MSPDVSVSELIDSDLRLWKRPALEQFFMPDCVNFILSIPLSSPVSDDKLVWKLDNTGIFSVKSAYYSDQDARFQPPDGTLNFAWAKLWKAKLQSRLKLLLWKFVSRALPVKSKLFFL